MSGFGSNVNFFSPCLLFFCSLYEASDSVTKDRDKSPVINSLLSYECKLYFQLIWLKIRSVTSLERDLETRVESANVIDSVLLAGNPIARF